MKLYFRSFVSALLTGVLGAIPLVLIFVFYTLPELRTLSFDDKKENIQVAVQSVFEILNHFHEKEKDGSLSTAEAQAQALALLKSLRYSGNEYFWVNNTEPRMIMHPFKPELNGKDLSQMKDPKGRFLFNEMVKVTEGQSSEGIVEYEWAKPNSEKPVPKISFVKRFSPWGWIIGSGVYVDNVELRVQQLQKKDMQYFAIGLVFLILITCFNAYLQIKTWIIPIQKVLKDLSLDSTSLQDSAKKINRASKDLSEQVTTQAAAIQETVASMEQMSAMLAQSANQTALNLNNTTEGESKSDLTRKNFLRLNRAMDEISQSNSNLDKITQLMSSINDKTKIINNIVTETRLLSFNASIEAARAGTHGKGFSVVSEEIGKLAQVSGKAAEEIAGLLATSNQEVSSVVQDIQGKVHLGQKIYEECSKDIDDISTLLSRIQKSSEVISKATKEQEIGVKQTNKAMNQMESVTHTNSTNAQDLEVQAKDLLGRAESIQRAIKNLSEVVKLDEAV